jgi:hypothetical protein
LAATRQRLRMIIYSQSAPNPLLLPGASHASERSKLKKKGDPMYKRSVYSRWWVYSRTASQPQSRPQDPRVIK